MAGAEQEVVLDAVIVQDIEDAEGQTTDKNDKLIKLPLTRIKSIIKMDPDVNLASHDAVVMLAKAAEIFVSELASASYFYTASANRKTVQKKDVDNAIDKTETLTFLEGTIE